MATVTLRLDDAVKEKIDQFCNETGMNITTFYMLYTNKVLKEGKIPFEIEGGKAATASKQQRMQAFFEAAKEVRLDSDAVSNLRKESMV